MVLVKPKESQPLSHLSAKKRKNTQTSPQSSKKTKAGTSKDTSNNSNHPPVIDEDYLSDLIVQAADLSAKHVAEVDIWAPFVVFDIAFSHPELITARNTAAILDKAKLYTGPDGHLNDPASLLQVIGHWCPIYLPHKNSKPNSLRHKYPYEPYHSTVDLGYLSI